MTDVTVRSANFGDLDQVLALYRHLHPKDAPPDSLAARRAWSKLLDSGLTTTFVAEEAGLLVSSCTLAIIPNLSRGARPYGVVENVVTLSSHRERGYGRAVLQAAVARAWESDCYKVLLATGSRRETTLRFYEKSGFARGGKTYFEIRKP